MNTEDEDLDVDGYQVDVYQMDEDPVDVNIDDYTDEELYSILDLTNPSDRVLEAKILMMIEKYTNQPKTKEFFENIYNHFFDDTTDLDPDLTEGFETMDKNPELKIPKTQTQPEKSVDLQSQLDQLTNAIISLTETFNKQSITEKATLKGKNDTEYTKSFILDYSPNNLNPLFKQTSKRVIYCDSNHRDMKLYPESTNYFINLSDPVYNAVMIKLQSINIPFCWDTITDLYKYNYFTLTSQGPLANAFQFKITVPPGTYNTSDSLTTAFTTALNLVKTQNPDTNFGQTAINVSSITGKMSMTLDIQNVYTTANYSLIFPTTSIPNFLGFTAASKTYPLSRIYSTQPPIDPNAATQFSYIAGVNNFFTIYNYDGSNDESNDESNPFSPSTSIIYDTIRVTLTQTPATSPPNRANLTTQLNTALQNNLFLDPTSSIIWDPSTSRYILNILLNRNTTTKAPGMNQIIVFPAADTSPSQPNPIWTGPNSCFQFSPNQSLQQLNTVTAEVPLPNPETTITLNQTNNTIIIRPQTQPIIRGLPINDIILSIPSTQYTQTTLIQAINTAFSNRLTPVNPTNPNASNTPWSPNQNPLSKYILDSSNQYAQFRFNINRTFTAKDYIMTVFDISSAGMYNANIGGTCTIMPQLWCLTLGWQMGWKSSPIYNLDPTIASTTPLSSISSLSTSTQTTAAKNAYNYDPTTNRITLTGDSLVDIYQYNNFFLILDDFTMNRLNDGLITGSETDKFVRTPNYANKQLSKKTYGNTTINQFNSNITPSSSLSKSQNWSLAQTTPKILSQTNPPPPSNLPDCFAIIPLKFPNPTQSYVEMGGSLQDNNRMYYGPVNIRQLRIQLVNDRGEIVNLKGAKWTFTLTCEYLSMKTETEAQK
jgi:hypothetical protein